MSYMIKAVLGVPQHPERGQITVPFPIPSDQYDQTIEMLQELGLGFSVNRDCVVEEVDSCYSVLGSLKDTLVNIDQLDYLAKRLDSFDNEEAAQFQAMAHKLELIHIKDLINLTFCCQQATVIRDFSDLEKIGKDHRMTLNGGCMPTEWYQGIDGRKEALELIQNGQGTITPYGVVYDNGMELAQLYNGRQFPAYLYGNEIMALEIRPKEELREGQNPEYIYLPASSQQIERTMLRAGIVGMGGIGEVQMSLDFDTLPGQVTAVLDMRYESPSTLNALCHAVENLDEKDWIKLDAVTLMAGPDNADELRQLAANLDQFDFVPGVQTPEEYGKYMIQESGRFEYDEHLEGFYDYRLYGEQRVRQEGGQFNERGYVSYHGAMPLAELMREDPAEQYQREQGLQMGGLT